MSLRQVLRSWLGRFSLQTEVAAGFAVMMGLILALAAVSLLSQYGSVRAVDDLTDVDGRIAELGAKGDAALLKARRAEKDFLLSRTQFAFNDVRSRYATLVRAHIADLRQNMAEIRRLTASAELIEASLAIERSAADYESGFQGIVQLYGRLGYVDTGLEGELGRQAHALESTVREAGHDRLLVDLLSLRRHEKDFVLRRQDQYARAFVAAMDRFNADADAAAVPAPLKAKLRPLADEYRDLFEQYVRLENQIEDEKTDYLAAAHALEPPLEKLLFIARQNAIETRDGAKHAARVTSGTIIVAAGCALLVSLLVAWFIFHNLRERARQLAESNEALQAEVSVRRQTEESLRLRNRAIESSVNALYIRSASPEGLIEYVNPAFERITGYSKGEAIGRHPLFLVGSDNDQVGMQGIRAALEEEREAHAVVRNYRKDGTLFWSDLHLAPVRDNRGVVTHFVGVFNDVTETKRYEQELERQTNYDALTGLANRNLLQDRLAQALAHGHRRGAAVAVAFVDLDNFKLINDGLGHNAGDELLKLVAGRLRSCVRDIDTVARLGGDEFVLVLTDLPKAELISKIPERILEAISSPATVAGHDFNVTCSIGLSLYPADGRDAETLLKNADAAMYRAKEGGRNTFRFYTAEMNARIGERLSMQAMLRRAIEREEFTLHYQPKLHLRTGRVTGVEALLRWNSPDLGSVPPLKFIPVLEDSGMIVAVGRWVLQRAVTDYRRESASNADFPRIAVNVSQLQLGERDFVAVVAEILRNGAGGPPGLELEITESLIMKDAEDAIAKLKSIRETGVTVAIDDFGTGYSSLSHLVRLPVDTLKIDRAFVRSIDTQRNDVTVVSTIISLAHSLKLKVVAEGVEREEQAKLLRLLQCDEMQGYLFSKPLPLQELTGLLRARAETKTAASGDRQSV